MTADELRQLVNSSNFYDRYDKSKNWDFLGVMAGRAMQSAEFNEIQHILEDKIKSIGNALYSDGTIIEGCAISYDTNKKSANLGEGKVFLDGLVYDVDAATIAIPDDFEHVQVGIWKVSKCVTEFEDNSLFDPAKGTPQYHMPGGYRIVTRAIWGLNTDGLNSPFFPVYGVSDGEMVTQLQEKISPDYQDALARYDNHAHGHYVVSGLRVTALQSEIQGEQVFSISEGEAHINGYEAYLSHSVRLFAEELPNLADVKAEAHPFNAQTGGTATIQFSHSPIEELQQILITKERTVTLTHGGYAGCTDELPNTSVFEIVDLYQGALHYVKDSDFHFANDKINWALDGEEPAPYSTYTITYRYRDTIQADSFDTKQITISGAVENSLVEIDYSYRMPRIDLIVMYKDQTLGIVRGVAHRYAPIAPNTPPDAICLAQVIQTWEGLPEIINVAVQRVGVDVLNSMQTQIRDLYSLVAKNEQRFNAMIDAPTSAYNVFVDPLFDDDMRDKGLEQDALIAAQTLQLPLDVGIFEASLNYDAVLDYNHEIVINQPLHTKSMQINPYQNFTPLPAIVEIDPAEDRYLEIIEGGATKVAGSYAANYHIGGIFVDLQSITENTIKLEAFNLRQIQVKIHATGFGYSEGVTVFFDGVKVNCSSNQANSQGIFDGVFTIPPNIPAGTKIVELVGSAETRGAAYFVGSNEKRTVVRTYNYRYAYDPLAQSFMLNEARQISGVDFWLENKGNSEVRIELHTMENGYPTSAVLATSRIKQTDLIAKSWNRAIFETPAFLEAGVEYAISIMADTSDHTVGIAELGDWDSTNGWIRSQAYSEGVLFSSSNASTWTPHQNADLAFRLLAANFANNTKTISLGIFDLTGVTDIMVLGEVESTNSTTHATFILRKDDVEIARMQAWQPIALSTILSGEYSLDVELHGDNKFSPVVGRYPQLLTGKLQIKGEYISRAFSCGQNKRVMISTDEYKPNGSEIEYFIQTGQDSWVQSSEISDSNELGNGWVRRRRFVNCDFGAPRLKIILHGSAASRPLIQNISAVILDA